MRARRGLTLIEVMVTLAIVLLLAGVLTAGVTAAGRTGKEMTMEAQLQQVAHAVRVHEVRHGTLPDGLEGVVSAAQATDLWGTPVAYDREGDGFALRSAGPDRRPDTEDDVVWTGAD